MNIYLKLLLLVVTIIGPFITRADPQFRYCPEFDWRIDPAMEIRSVTVSGTFNGWNTTLHNMHKDDSACHRLELNLNPGIYHYKFVVNGNIWLEDLYANSKLRQDDGTNSGTYNSGVQVINEFDIKDIPDWTYDAVWYQIFPERFRNGNPNNDPTLEDLLVGQVPNWQMKNWTGDWYQLDPWEVQLGGFNSSILYRRYGGDLQGIIEKMDYLQNLGITAIYLNPIFISPSHHKYDGSSFHHIDPTFGPDPTHDLELLAKSKETDDPSTWIWTKADKLFLKLVKELHSRGMKIIIDGVFNHSGRYFFAFDDILTNRQNSRYKDWYEIKRWDDSLDDGFEYDGWFGHDSLPEFREDENGFDPGYYNYLHNITKRWMAPNGKASDGVDGWRLDVAFCVQHNIWKKWRKDVKSINPDAYITAEIWEEAPEYLSGDEFDGLMNYPFAHSVVEFIVDQKNKITASEFDRKLQVTRNSYPKKINGVLQNLMSSHDTSRLRTLIVNPDLNYRDVGQHFHDSKISNNHQYNIDRGTPLDKKAHKLIALLQMTYLGAPMIYYGDEVGMTGANDPDCRKPMLWRDLEYLDEKVHPIPGYTRPTEQNVADMDLFDYYKNLIAIRHGHIALRRGTFENFHIDNQKQTYGFIRQHEDETVWVLINSTEGHKSISPQINYGTYVNLLTNEPFIYNQINQINLEEKSGLVFIKQSDLPF